MPEISGLNGTRQCRGDHRARGWVVAIDPVPALAECYGRPMTEVPMETMLTSVLGTADKPTDKP